MTTEEFQTEKYLVENPEYADYLRRANRPAWSFLAIRRAVARWGMILSLSVAGLWLAAHLGGLTSQAHHNGSRLGKIMKSMFSELNQEQKIWDSI